MASVRSLGIHKPTAVPLLVEDGTLSSEPASQDFTWQTFCDRVENEDEGEDELLTTGRVVVWSRGSVVQRVFRFAVEGERVTHAAFTYFASDSKPRSAMWHLSLRTTSGTLNEKGALSVGKQQRTLLRDNTPEDTRSLPLASGNNAPLPTADDQLKYHSRNRALVVVLKNQAHIFFLSGKSYIVHLPFDVEALFPIDQGVIFQRRLPEKRASTTPKIPQVPMNSFAFQSQGSFSRSTAPGKQERSHFPHVMHAIDPPLLSMPDRARGPIDSPEPMIPRLFCLDDPLLELCPVIVEDPHPSSPTRTQDTRSSRPFDGQEGMLYVSAQDEMGSLESTTSIAQALTFALSINPREKEYNVWTVKDASVKCSPSSNAPRASSANTTASRRRSRRSSYNSRIATGSTTPVNRGPGAARESFGTFRSIPNPGNYATNEEHNLNGEDDLGIRLDVAFDDSARPTKSSRRISSLLAREDLSTSHETASFNDVAGGHPGPHANRRGASFGYHARRSTSGSDFGISTARSRPEYNLRSSLDRVRLSLPPVVDLMDDFDDSSDERTPSPSNLPDDVPSLRREVVLSKICTFSSDEHDHLRYKSSAQVSSPKVFVLRSPKHDLTRDPRHDAFSMYIMERTTRTLTVLSLGVKSTPGRSWRTSNHKLNTAALKQTVTHAIRVTDLTRRHGIIDACKITDGACSRVLILQVSADGMGELSIEAPWTIVRKISLPENLLVHDPFRLLYSFQSRQNREGGFKRILSRGPRALSAIQHADSAGRFDLVDAEGLNHRIKLQLVPEDPFIRKMICACEAVLPALDLDAESILTGWCDVFFWLQSNTHEDLDLEWAAFVVVLFSMAAQFMEGRHPAVSRQKKRKGGLLRSSSGANTDLNSWESMMSEESNCSGLLPPWMQDAGWKWTVSPNPVGGTIQQAASQQTRSSKSLARQSLEIPMPKKSSALLNYFALAVDFIKSPIGLAATGPNGYFPTAASRHRDQRRAALGSVLVSLHLFREELKLDVFCSHHASKMTPILAQIGSWVGWENWGFKNCTDYSLDSVEMEAWLFVDSFIHDLQVPTQPFLPPSILQHLEDMFSAKGSQLALFPTILGVVDSTASSVDYADDARLPQLKKITPRTFQMTKICASGIYGPVEDRISRMGEWNIDMPLLDSLPESIAAPFRAAVSYAQSQPWKLQDKRQLELVGRDDVSRMQEEDPPEYSAVLPLNPQAKSERPRDVHSICNSSTEVELISTHDGAVELDRQAITRLIFKEDQRFSEACKLLHPLHPPAARCTPEPEWSDTEFLEAQQELAKTVALRTLSVSLGRGLIFFSARSPLLTEKFPTLGFTLSCVIKPSNTTVTADRNLYTEEKVSWAFFHAGVEAGLSISKNAKGINTSWILFNKPSSLQNRHAGFLFALGLNGHLKSVAKWVAFKYLTPKHTMTSIGLLLGLSASYLGTMDTLITRLLSVHVTRMLPPGAAELNLSPLTQTSGIMGIGLLYCNTQHRRMSEIMLSELENVDQEDNSSPLDSLRDESYRLAAGFALGFINLGRGKDLKGLLDMHMVERLLVLAVGVRKVSIVHILDKSTAAAIVATALIYMKTNDEALGRKIDIPDTIHQFDYVRPDIFLLRTVARHLIMWDSIQPSHDWVQRQLPLVYQMKMDMTRIRLLKSEDMPYLNIIAGLCLSVGLRFAGSGMKSVRDVLCRYLDQLIRICRLPTPNYDGKLARIAVRNCQDVIALSASCVMAGTGDLHIFRRLRSLHGRTDADTPWGSHLAAHFAIGILFLGGGTHTFGTSNLAIAALLCAFYPLFPSSVQDNKSHLQAFRHFWVLATEPRCLTVRELDTQRSIPLSILVLLRSGHQLAMTTPCLLPEIDSITSIQTTDPAFWTVRLHIAENLSHRRALATHQSIYVRRRTAYDTHSSVFSVTMQALNEAQSARKLSRRTFEWILGLPAFDGLDKADRALVVPPRAEMHLPRGHRGTVIDDRLVLETACMESGRSDRLWNLRLLFAWADAAGENGEEWNWLAREFVQGLKANMDLRRGSAHPA